jgi:hypothetical protein
MGNTAIANQQPSRIHPPFPEALQDIAASSRRSRGQRAKLTAAIVGNDERRERPRHSSFSADRDRPRSSSCCLVCQHELRRPRQARQWHAPEAIPTELTPQLAVPVYPAMGVRRFLHTASPKSLDVEILTHRSCPHRKPNLGWPSACLPRLHPGTPPHMQECQCCPDTVG